MKGTIVKAISGFYYVKSNSTVYECKARGVFKNKGITPLVGDEVEFDGAVVTDILPRRNAFERPPVANVEVLAIVMAAADPEPSFEILDRFILTAEEFNTDVVVCINKCDIASEEIIKKFKNIYSPIYPTFFISSKTGNGVEEFKNALKGKCFALAGPSGVGKSSLTNLLLGTEESEVGEISKKSLRGKNTTRHTELFEGDGYSVFDTPGFTSFDACVNDETELDQLFPEFREYIGSCRFDDCRHLEEPDCAIRKATDNGYISESRYDSYKKIYKSIIDNRRY